MIAAVEAEEEVRTRQFEVSFLSNLDLSVMITMERASERKRQTNAAASLNESAAADDRSMRVSESSSSSVESLMSREEAQIGTLHLRG